MIMNSLRIFYSFVTQSRFFNVNFKIFEKDNWWNNFLLFCYFVINL